MNHFGIDLNDAGLCAALGPKLTIPASPTEAPVPALAWWDGAKFRFGSEAEAHVLLNPLTICGDYLENLSMTPAEVKVTGKEPSNADLLYYQLKEIWKPVQDSENPPGAVLALPSSWLHEQTPGDEERVAITLGLASSLGLPLRALVASSAVSLLSLPEVPEGRFLMLDWRLQAGSVSVVEVADGHVRLLDAQRAHGSGARAFIEALLAKLREEFISQTAFDVTHNAKTEQEFYAKAREAFHLLSNGAQEAVVSMGTIRPRVVRLNRAAAHQIASDSLLGLRDLAAEMAQKHAGISGVLVTHRIGRLPGWRKLFPEFPLQQQLPIGAAALGAARLSSLLPAPLSMDETPLLSEFPLPPALATKATAPPSVSESKQIPAAVTVLTSAPFRGHEPKRPTHLVHHGLAHALGAGPFRLSARPIPAAEGLYLPLESEAEVGDYGSVAGSPPRLTAVYPEETFLNGRALRSNPVELKPGDRLAFGSASAPLFEVQFIHVPPGT